MGLENSPKRLDAVNIKLCNSKNAKTYADYDNTPVMNLVLMEQQMDQLDKVIQSEIDNGNPLIVNFQNPNGGHFITIIGYKYVNGEMKVIYYDSSDSYNEELRVNDRNDKEKGDIGQYEVDYKELLGGTQLGKAYSVYSYRSEDQQEDA